MPPIQWGVSSFVEPQVFDVTLFTAKNVGVTLNCYLHTTLTFKDDFFATLCYSTFGKPQSSPSRKSRQDNQAPTNLSTLNLQS